MAIKLYSLGAAQEVTGSKHVLEISDRQYLVDCGAFQGKRKIADEKNRNFDMDLDKLHAVVLTHSHYDHCGLLPLLAKKGFNGNIYSTPAARDLSNIIMMDSARIQARDAEYLAKQAHKKGKKFYWKPIFNEQDCIKAANQIVTLSYDRQMFLSPEVKIEFFDAGHILGSAMAMFYINEKHSTDPQDEVKILYTGDLGRKNKPIIRDPCISMPAPDYLFIESTYGNKIHEDKQVALNELIKVVRQAIELKGKIIIPSFAIERAQELIYDLHLLVDQKKIPSIPIYVDSPMAVNATGVFRLHPECYDSEVNEQFLQHHKNPFGFGALSYITSVEESKALNKKEGPMIIISADGMCEAGRVLHHLANNISDPCNQILIVGYMAENTLGRRLRDGEKRVRILGDWYDVKAEVTQINAFSAHADYKESLEWLQSIDTSRLKRIFMVHGEKDAQTFFKDFLNKKGFNDITIVKYGETYTI